MKRNIVSGESLVDLEKLAETPSSIYVPSYLQKGLEGWLKRKGLNLRGLLRLLLDGYEQALETGEIRQSEKGKKLYQQPGLGLVKMNFYPGNGDWATLTAHAHGLGYARNLLVVKLLILLLLREGFLGKGLPTKRPKFLSKKLRRLKHVCFVEILEIGRHLRRAFSHDP